MVNDMTEKMTEDAVKGTKNPNDAYWTEVCEKLAENGGEIVYDTIAIALGEPVSKVYTFHKSHLQPFDPLSKETNETRIADIR